MPQVPRYSDHDLEPLRAALLALSKGDFASGEFRAASAAAGHGVLGQIWPLVDAVAAELATLNAQVARRAERVLATVSHELRTPLNSLLVLAKLLSENPDGNLTVQQVEFAKTIHDAGADLLQLTNDILDLFKVEAGKMEVHVAPITVGALLDSADATFRPTAEQKGLSFATGVDPGVPPVIYADEQRLAQVLRNLVSNAVKFTHRGGVTLRVTLAAAGTRFTGPLREEKTVLAFVVTDTGIGIAEEKLELIFRAFQQADLTTSRGYGGTGLGLSISRDIARLLGGEIHATSRLGHGSAFTFYLPDRREPLAAGRGAGSATTGPFGIRETGGADWGSGAARPACAPGATSCGTGRA